MEIRNQIDHVVLPSKLWTKGLLEHFNNIIFVEWNDHYDAVKKVVLHENMQIQVIFSIILISQHVTIESGKFVYIYCML